jgi:hypothetical protein
MTSKRTFERNLRTVIGEYSDADQVDDEIADLRQILSNPHTSSEPQ